MSGVLQPKLRLVRSLANRDNVKPGDVESPEMDDEPTNTAIRPATRVYANDGPDTTAPVADADADADGDDKPEPITWMRSRHPRLQH